MLQAERTTDASGKRNRPYHAGGGGPAGDRLSALPDCLLHAIMSFMKARQVVQTCVLSTRWRHLWRSVPCLDVDQEEFKTAAANGDHENFVDFTDNLLFRHAIALLDSFRLHVSDRYFMDYHAARWIRQGIKNSTQIPGIQREGLSSSSWRVKSLHLSGVNLDERFAKHVSSGCHSLEDLELERCSLGSREITSHSLKVLVLKDCWCSELEITSTTLKNLVIQSGTHIHTDLLFITAPAVTNLLLANACYEISGGVNDMPSLAKALIRLRVRGNSVGSTFHGNQCKLLSSISNVTSLELSDFQTMVLEESEKFPAFKNLRTLLLDDCYLSDNCQTLGHFLQNSPNLEKLTLRCCKFTNDTKRRKGKAKLKRTSLSQFRNLVDVQCQNLKLTEIIYKDDDDVRQLVELLLGISGNLPNNNIKLTKVD